MKKYLITGFSGFVSHHFLEYLDSLEEKIQVQGIDINKPDFDYNSFKNIDCSFNMMDLLNKEDVDDIIYQFQPDYILHLASFSSVAFSWQNPVVSFTNNTNIFLNLLEQVKNLGLKCRILSVGSSEEYGNVNEKDIPLKEDSKLNPVSPYAVARVSQELLSKVYVDGYDLDIALTRSFNHIGPRQKDIFVISSFVKKIVEIKHKNTEPKIATGNLEIIRDFLDVRDVVRAYYEILQRGKKGEIYNICSGEGTSLNTIVTMISNILEIEIETLQDPSLVRPNDNKIIIGDNTKITSEIGWKPTISLDKSLRDIVKYWEKEYESIN
ncbi:GDP-mannose 4,6-dehydratase [Chryseobacterium sp. KACC 21268]|nr:GDP-mannose 4,6-dehydratase [Chryseobacterium sp. KACC 21268]